MTSSISVQGVAKLWPCLSMKVVNESNFERIRLSLSAAFTSRDNKLIYLTLLLGCRLTWEKWWYLYLPGDPGKITNHGLEEIQQSLLQFLMFILNKVKGEYLKKRRIAVSSSSWTRTCFVSFSINLSSSVCKVTTPKLKSFQIN